MLLALLGLLSSLIEVSPAPGSYASIQQLSFTVYDESTVKYTLNGGAEQTYSTPITLSENTEVSYWSVDGNGVASEISTINYIIDLIAPTTSINHPAGLYNSALEITLTADEASTIRYKIGTGAYQVYTAPFSISTDCTISYYATDTLGNVETVKTATFTFDFVTPVTTIKPTPGAYLSSQSITLKNNEPGSQIYYSLNGGPDILYTGAFTLVSDTTVNYYSQDAAGNKEVTKTAVYIIDNIAPVTSISPTPGLYSGVQYITLTTNETATIQYSINNGPWLVYTEPFILGEDANIRYRATDIAGNIEEIKTAVYNVTDVTVYRINGGPWIPYIEPFDCKHYDKVEAAIRYTGGAFSDINEEKYNIIDTTDQWVMVG